MGTVPCLINDKKIFQLIFYYFQENLKTLHLTACGTDNFNCNDGACVSLSQERFQLDFPTRHFVLVEILIYIVDVVFFYRVACPIHNGTFESLVLSRMTKIFLLFLLKIDSLQMWFLYWIYAVQTLKVTVKM